MTVRVVQITNVSTQCQKEQIRSLFAHLGRIEDIQLYPDSETLSSSVGAKVAYIKYDKSEVAQAALQLTNTVFIDRNLICCLVKNGKVPDETEAVKFCAPLNPNINLISVGLTWSNTIINRVVGTGSTSVIETIDPALTERSLPPYPSLPGTLDPSKVEEIRRTIFVSNIMPHVSLENLNDLFSQVGEIRFIRFAGDESAATKSAYIEFSEQHHIIKALCLNGLSFGGKHIKVNHATSSIIKPATSKQIFASREKTPKHSSSRKRSKSPSSYKPSKKRSSRSPRRRSSSRKRSDSKKHSKSPHKHSSSTKKHSNDREKRRRSSSSKAKKRSRSKDRKRSKSKDVKKRRSSSRNRDVVSSKSSKKTESSRHSSSGHVSKSSRHRSRSTEKRSSPEVKKSKSKDNFPLSPPENKNKSKDRKHDEKLKSPSDDIEKYSVNGKSKIPSPKIKEAKLYGPNPPPPTKVSISSSSDSSSSSNSSSSDEDDDDENATSAMDH